MADVGWHVAPSISLGIDSDSLILQAIAGLCAHDGIPQERMPYFQEKAQPLLALVAEFLMETMPRWPERSLMLWLASGLGGRDPSCAVPPALIAQLTAWADREPLYQSFEQAAAEQLVTAPVRSGDSRARSRSRTACTDDQRGQTPLSSLQRSSRLRNSARASRKSTSFSGLDFQELIATHGGVDALTHEMKVDLVAGVPLFQSLEFRDVEDIAKACKVCTYADGEDAMHHGEGRQGMHIVVEGQAQKLVIHDAGVVGPGEAFGATEMMKGIALNETIEAVGGPLTTLHLDHTSFKALGLQQKLGQMQRRRGHKARDLTDRSRKRTQVRGGVASGSATQEELATIEQAIAGNQNIKEVLNLTEEQIALCAQEAIRRDYDEGDVVFLKGDYGQRFYIVISGVFVVTRSSLWAEKDQATEVRLEAGHTFGELALLHNAPRTATVTCGEAGSVWVVSRSTLRKCREMQLECRVTEFAHLLCGIEFIRQHVPERAMPEVCAALEEKIFYRGEVVLTEGKPVECFSVVFDGQCVSTADGAEEEELGRGTYFGEHSLLHTQPVVAPVTIQVKSEMCTVLRLTRASFRACVHEPRGLQVVGSGSMLTHLSRNCLERVGVLGTGAFGFVSLERDTESGSLYALKAMSKGHIKEAGLTSIVVNEKTCQQLLDSDFIVRLLGTFRDQQLIYLLLEPCFGGELFELFSGGAVDLTGSEEHCRFFVGCVSLGLEHMHSRRVIWRDLKLENCLLTLNGYVKLTDMGIAKICVGKTYTVCGTTDYFAPEMLRQSGHNRAVDWWALGVMIYMMMTGRTPFEASETIKIYRKIVKGFAKVNFPDDFPEDCVALVKGLCQRHPEERLTMGPCGTQKLKDHVWFRGFSWTSLEALSLPAPYKPSLTEEQVIERVMQKVSEHFPEVPYEPDDSTEGQWDDAFDMDLDTN